MAITLIVHVPPKGGREALTNAVSVALMCSGSRIGHGDYEVSITRVNLCAACKGEGATPNTDGGPTYMVDCAQCGGSGKKL